MDPSAGQKHPKEKASENGSADSNKLDLRNEIQAEYGSSPIPWFPWVFSALDLPPGCRLLELGGGTGGLWQENEARIPPGWTILLSDHSLDMMQDAREKLSERQKNMRFLGIDSQQLPFPAEAFDAVLAIGLLDLVPDLGRVLSETWRVLRPSGQLYASAGGKGHLRELEELVEPFLPGKKAERLGGEETRFGLENGAAMLAQYFEEVVRLDFRDQMVFTSPQPVLDYILSEKIVAWSMPLDQLGKFTQQVRRELEQRGKITVTIRKGIFIARKKVIE